MTATFLLDGVTVPFLPGQSILQAALAHGRYIPHLCYHPEFRPHGSCKVCTSMVQGKLSASCTPPAAVGIVVQSDSDELRELRRTLVQMLFAEGNHFCPSCEKSGSCQLQALASDLGVTTAGFRHYFPDRPVDASHPDAWIDFNRCVLCELCVLASAEVDGKDVFAVSGRGLTKQLIMNSPSGRLGETRFAATDKAMQVCPVGAILPKRVGFAIPIGERRFDRRPVSRQAFEDAPRASGDADV
jgi:[NiFe] hydrogenase diaphorase moiety small subunit